MRALRIVRTLRVEQTVPLSHYPGMTELEAVQHEQNLDLEELLEVIVVMAEDGPMVTTEVYPVDLDEATMTGPTPPSDAEVKDAMDRDENRWR